MTGSWSVCPACGSLVADTILHADWHDVLAGRLTAGGAADGGAWAGGPVPTISPITPVEQERADADRAALDAIAATAGRAHVDGDPWVRPTHALNAYRMGAVVTHADRLWSSLIPFNATMPGDPADPQAHRWWQDITPKPEPEPGPQPWGGSGVRYLTGVEVTYEGRTYRVRQDHASQPDWPPPAVPALYLPI